MTNEEAKKKATKMAIDLFTDVAGRSARRLMMDYDGNGGGTGWSIEAVEDRLASAIALALADKQAEIDAAHAALRDMPTEPFRSVGNHTLTLAERIKNVEGMWRVAIKDAQALAEARQGGWRAGVDELVRILWSEQEVLVVGHNEDSVDEARVYAKPGHTIDDAGKVSKARALAVPAGCVRDENGVDRKVLGELPLTADGCVVGMHARLYYFDEPYEQSHYPTDDSAFFDDIVFMNDECVGGSVPFAKCYSTREAASSALSSTEKGEVQP